MKKLRTLIWLRISVILQIVFAAFCTSTVICVVAYKLLRHEVLLFLSIVSMYGWMINPAGPVTLVLGLTFTFIDYRLQKQGEPRGHRLQMDLVRSVRRA